MIVHGGKQTCGQTIGIVFPGTNDLKQAIERCGWNLIRLEGQGTKVQSVELDGRQVPQPVIPSPCYDGKRHAIVIRVQPSS